MTMDWNPATAQRVLDAFLATLPLRPEGARLVSFRQTALFHLPVDGVSVRIHAPHEAPGRALPMLECARWLERQAFPVVLPAEVPVDQPIVVNGCQIQRLCRRDVARSPRGRLAAAMQRLRETGYPGTRRKMDGESSSSGIRCDRRWQTS